MTAREIMRRFHGGLLVSCQPAPGGPFDTPRDVAGFAAAALKGGARGVRIEGLANIREVRRTIDQPIIGLVKRREEGVEIYITPTPTDIAAVAAAGACVIAFDGTNRPRAASVKEMIACVHEHGCLAMADVSTYAEGLQAFELGSDYVGTTLSGYTPYSRDGEAPDFELVRALAQAQVRVIAEGRLNTPALARRALDLGAFAVTVGTMITRPECITRAFVGAMEGTRLPPDVPRDPDVTT